MSVLYAIICTSAQCAQPEHPLHHSPPLPAPPSLPPLPGASHPPPSAGLEASLRYQLSLVAEVCAQLPAARLAVLGPRLLALADRLLGLNSRALHLEAASLPGLLAMAACRYWLEPTRPWADGARAGAAAQAQGGAALALVGAGVELWVDKYGAGYEKPRCARASDQGGRACARACMRD